MAQDVPSTSKTLEKADVRSLLLSKVMVALLKLASECICRQPKIWNNLWLHTYTSQAVMYLGS